MAELLMHRVESITVGKANKLTMDDGRVVYSRPILIKNDEEIMITMFSDIKKNLTVKQRS